MVDLGSYRYLDMEQALQIYRDRARSLEQRHFEMMLELETMIPGPGEPQPAFQARQAAMHANLAAVASELMREYERVDRTERAIAQKLAEEQSRGKAS